MKPSRLVYFVLIVLLVLGAACTEEAKKPTEDSAIAMELLDLVEGLRDSYSSKNFSGMSRFCTKEAFEQIKAGLRSFDTVSLEFTPRWIEVSREGDHAEMLVGWRGRWTSGEETTQKEGTVFFAFSGKPYTITRVDRLSPFSQP